MRRDYSLVLASFILRGLILGTLYMTRGGMPGWRGVVRASFNMCDPA
jgi:hypothetical protein